MWKLGRCPKAILGWMGNVVGRMFLISSLIAVLCRPGGEWRQAFVIKESRLWLDGIFVSKGCL